MLLSNYDDIHQLPRVFAQAHLQRFHNDSIGHLGSIIRSTTAGGDSRASNDDEKDAQEIDEDIRAVTKQRDHKTRTVNRAYANQTGASFGIVWDSLIRTALRAWTLWQDFWGVQTILKLKKRSRISTSKQSGHRSVQTSQAVVRGSFAGRSQEALWEPNSAVEIYRARASDNNNSV